ncbi:MAG TPA: hypothetical protein VFI65_10655 [Streptosporangiaceae bacterium]|nr:hypothetical protein [Streptosporangiaceae bacterium]
MLLWINGPFGGGKTHAADEIRRRLDGSIICDPEQRVVRRAGGSAVRVAAPVPHRCRSFPGSYSTGAPQVS